MMMIYVLAGLGTLLGVASLVCFVMVLIKMFAEENKTPAIIALVTCGIYGLIWGWQNQPEKVSKNLMLAWSALIGGSAVLQVILRIMMASLVTPE